MAKITSGELYELTQSRSQQDLVNLLAMLEADGEIIVSDEADSDEVPAADAALAEPAVDGSDLPDVNWG